MDPGSRAEETGSGVTGAGMLVGVPAGYNGVKTRRNFRLRRVSRREPSSLTWY